MNRYFILSCGSEYLSKREYHLKAPEPTTKDYFDDLCRKLAKEAAKNLMEKFSQKLIAWSDIVDEIAELLITDYDYKFVYPQRFTFRGKTDCINPRYPRNEADEHLGDVLSDVLNHNDVATWDCQHHQAVS